MVESIKNDQDELFFKIRRWSPVRSWVYLKGHRKLALRIKWNLVEAEIDNIWAYPLSVEQWWRKTAVNWHLLDGRILRNKWAEVYKRATESMRWKVTANISKSIW